MPGHVGAAWRRRDVVRIYGFHAVAAGCARRGANSSVFTQPRPPPNRWRRHFQARVETKIVAVRTSPRERRRFMHQGLLLEAKPLAPIDVSELP